MKFTDIIHKDHIEYCMGIFKGLQRGETFDDVETVFVSKDGKTIHVAGNVNSYFKDGKFVATRGIVRDITERKRAEEELQKRTYDLGERVKELNCLYGISDLVQKEGVSLEKILEGTVNLIPPSWQYPEITCARITLEDQGFKTDNFRETAWKQTSDIRVHGRRIGTLEVCYLEERPESEEGPFLKQESNLINEIAERLGRIIDYWNVERELRIKEEAIASSINAITLADLEGNLTYVNFSFLNLWGYNEDKEVLGKPVAKLLQEEKEALEVIEALRKKKSWMGELVARRKDGSTFDVQLLASTVRDEVGEAICIMASLVDITKRRQAEKKMEEYAEELAAKNEELKVETEKAKEADRLKSEFLASVSHEIRTPLSTIKGAAYLLNKSSLSEEQRRFCSMIRDSGEHLLRIINDILDLARIEAGQARLEEKELSLKELVEKTVFGFELRAKRKGLELNTIYPSDLPLEIRADEGKLSQVLTNLVDNALKFTQQGKVEVKLEKLADLNIRLQVKDTGIGISEQKLSRIFEKFYQVDGTSRRKYEGTGLGLTIVRELAKLMAGKIEAKSILGKGSTFSFTFPYSAAKQRMVQAKDQAKPKTKQQLRKEINILIAEDDDSGYYIMESLLDDYTTSRAVDGREVLEKIREKDYDLVLMDIQMPEMDGLEATRKIREKDSTLPIIALTAKAMKGDRERCLEAGCSDYLSKPIEPEELIAKVNQYLLKKARQKEK